MSLFNEITYTKEEITKSIDFLSRKMNNHKELALETTDDNDRELFSKKYFELATRIKELELKLREYGSN
jgi:hypothetical protein